MIQKFKERWEISKNWQLVHPALGILASLFCGYLIGKRILGTLPNVKGLQYYLLLALMSIALGYLFIQLSLWCFKKLKNKWQVNYRWEFIAIFLCFAVTGSSAGRVSDPMMELIGLEKAATSGWLYWPVRILLIFPIYQVLLLMYGWVFGQYTFFKGFATKMMSRLGLSFLFSK